MIGSGLDWNTLALVIIALANAAGAYFAWRTRSDLRTLEINTNSIKDALVARTAEAAEAKGRDDQRAIGEAKAAMLAQGRSETELEKAGQPNRPVPVSDSRTARAAESTAESTGRLATATEKIADSSEVKK